jgi:hypothetical protein
MLTRLNSERTVIEGWIDISMNSPARLEAGYAGNTRGRQTALRHNKPRQRWCRGVSKREHYVFDTKLRAFLAGLRETGRSAWLSPLSFYSTVLR